jgi:hypothetical protein
VLLGVYPRHLFEKRLEIERRILHLEDPKAADSV